MYFKEIVHFYYNILLKYIMRKSHTQKDSLEIDLRNFSLEFRGNFIGIIKFFYFNFTDSPRKKISRRVPPEIYKKIPVRISIEILLEFYKISTVILQVLRRNSTIFSLKYLRFFSGILVKFYRYYIFISYKFLENFYLKCFTV